MKAFFEKLKSLNLRIDLASAAPQQIESDEFLVHSKLEILKEADNGSLVPAVKIAIGGIDESPKVATQKSVEEIEKIFNNDFLNSLQSKGIGYEVATSQPFYQKSEEFLVVGKLEVFDYTPEGKPRTLCKVSFNVFNENPVAAQKEALGLVIDATQSLM